MTTASLHREMVEALRRVVDMLDGAENPFSAGSGHWYRWMERRVRELGAARAALGGWERREPLRDDPEARAAVAGALDADDRGAANQDVTTILGALGPLLYGERG